MRALDSEQRPPRPNYGDLYKMDDQLWNIVQLSWVQAPEDRPSSRELVSMMAHIA